jgi:hypothetical protein
MGWLTDWVYRKSHLITYAAGAGTNYQVKILVHSGSGSDSGDDVYLNGHCIDFPNDIDFTDDSGNTELKFWIEDLTADPITVWVKITGDLSSVNKTIYIYYGKGGQSSLSNGDATFLFFDHFAGSSLDVSKWNLANQPNLITVSGSIAHIAGTEAAWKWIVGLTEVGPYNIRVKHRSKILDASHYELIGIGKADMTNMATYYGSVEVSDYYYYQDNGSGYSFAHLPSLDNAWHVDMIEWINGSCKYYVDGTLDATEASYFPIAANKAFIGINTGGSGTAEIECDWIFLSKYVSPEPANSTWGAEDTSAGGKNYYVDIIFKKFGALKSSGIDVILSPRIPTVTIDGHPLDFIIDFERVDKKTTFLPEWINQTEAVDTYFWAKCLLQLEYTYRATQTEKWDMDQSLRAHTKVAFTDYILNLFSTQSGGVWIDSISCEWDPINWERPWKYTVKILAMDSDIESRSRTVVFDSIDNGDLDDHLGTMTVDGDDLLSGLPASNTLDCRMYDVHFTPPENCSIIEWQTTGDVYIVERNGNSITLFVHGNGTVTAVYGINE